MILPTAIATFTQQYKKFKLRAICDTGSHKNLITIPSAQKMKLITQPCHVKMFAVNSSQPYILNKKVELQLELKDSFEASIPVTLLLVPKITDSLPIQSFSRPILPTLIEEELADKHFNHSDAIDVLLGIEVWSQIIKNETKQINNNLLAQNSKIGWLICGSETTNEENTHTNIMNICSMTEDSDMELKILIKKLWEDEQLSDESSTILPNPCEELFISQHYRNAHGRLVVRIPLQMGENLLGESRTIALRRFYQLERRLQRDPQLRLKYNEFMRNYENLGHMVRTTSLPADLHYFIPHHCVQDKFRVVFDASCPTTNGNSLNKIQIVGPKLQGDLVDVIFRFRCFRVAVGFDVVKMFRQIMINPEQWDLQRIFWRYDSRDKLCEYWLTCVTQGMASAPFNAVRAMIQCARENKVTYPLALPAIEDNFYMDDGFTGAETTNDAIELSKEIRDCLQSAGFELDKWISNDKMVLHALNELTSDEIIINSESGVLGLRWIPDSDQFAIKIKVRPTTSLRNKREIVGELARIYDPCGYAAPVTVKAKMLIRDMCDGVFSWDDTISPSSQADWIPFHENLPMLTEVKIPRWLGCNKLSTHQLHAFSDASKEAYGGVIYLRVQQPNGTISSNMVYAKTRVVPIRKKQTIPRLELCAAELLSRMVNKIKKTTRIPLDSIHLWSDSQVALYWIAKSSLKLEKYVANRVQSIQKNTESMTWHYVPTNHNPADLLTREMIASDLINNRFWFNGPEWLMEDGSQWPNTFPEQCLTNSSMEEATVSMEMSEVTMVHVLNVKEESLMDRCSTLNILLRTTARVFKFIKKIRKNGGPQILKDYPMENKPYVTPNEYKYALNCWIQWEQRTKYATEIKSLTGSKIIATNSDILSLAPWIDVDGLMKVGGRIRNANVNFDQKHPSILPYDSRLSELIVNHTHKITCHGGSQLMMAVIRQKYWIPKLRQLIRKCIRHCPICIRYAQQSMTQIMADLPGIRVQQARPFQHVGVDFAGPFSIKERQNRRNPVISKGYVCVFVCLCTRAVHLELIEDLSTRAFLQGFTRLAARRGPVLKVWSDNGTNFVGAASSLKETREILNTWKDDLTQSQLAALGTEWNFITPSAPFQGGIWEAAVRSMKHHLRRVMKDQILAFPDFVTLCCQIEACLNSRPICAQSDDAADLGALPPGHFLIHDVIIQPYHRAIDDIPSNRLTEKDRAEKFHQIIWKRWSSEYLNELQKRNKWMTPQRNIELNDLVIIRNDQLPPSLWQLGRVIEIHPAADGFVRNVTVRTENSILRRPIQKLVTLASKEESISKQID